MFKNQWKNKSSDQPSKDGEISFIISKPEKDISLFEVKKASECIPEWWKMLSSTFKSNDHDKDLTLKSCVPFTDALMTGYVIVLAHDLNVKYNQESKTMEISSSFEYLKENFGRHPKDQADTMPVAVEYVDDLIYKWASNYLIKTPEGYSTLFVHPLNAPYLPFYTLSGVVDTDKYFMPVLFPFLMKNNYDGVIPKGTPIVQIIPIKRDRWNFKEYNNTTQKFEIRKGMIRKRYHAARQEKNGRIIGGVYKKNYRVRKEY